MQWAKQKQGFTIVELLIVIVVIAILAAITIVAYNGIQDRAKNASAQSATSQAVKKVLAYAAEHNDQFPTSLEDAGITNTAGLQYSGGGAVFCVTGTTQNISYFQSQAASNATTGACPGHGANGVPAIQNLVINPATRTSASNWSPSGGSTGTAGARVSGIGGLSSLNITSAYRVTLGPTAHTGWWRARTTTSYPVTAGTAYTLSGYMRPSVATTTHVIIQWLGASGVISEAGGSAANHSGGSWARRSHTAIAPAGATSANIFFNIAGGNASPENMTLDVSAAMFHPGSTLYAYADGESENWVWTNGANNSISTGPPSI